MEVDANTALWLDAIRTRSYDSARQLLRKGQDVNVRGAGGITALHVLARYEGTLDKIENLLVGGADPHLTDDYGRTPLQIAQRYDRTDIVYFLIFYDELLRALGDYLGRKPELADISAMMRREPMQQLRHDVQRRLEEKTTKLLTAARTGDLETVKGVVESGEITIDAVDTATRETAFSAALAMGRRRVCEYLLKNDAHLQSSFIIGGTRHSVLSMAASMRDVDFVRRLFARGAPLTVPDLFQNDTRTCPLTEAVKSGSTQMVDVLLELGARVSLHASDLCLSWPISVAFDFTRSILDDKTPWWLLTTASWQQDSTMIEHLFKTQAALSERSMLARHGARALFLAVFHQNESIVTDLLDRGVSINESFGSDVTGLVAAVAVNSVKMLRFLLDRGADANVAHTSLRSKTGYAGGLLSTALFLGAMDCARELVPMETRPQYFDRALSMAVKGGDVDFVRMLLVITLPSTREAKLGTFANTRCPLMVDLLLSRYTDENLDMAALQRYFLYACKSKSSEILAVFLAHGVDIDYEVPRGSSPPLTTALVQNYEFGVDVAKLLIESGVPLVPKRGPHDLSLLSRLATFVEVQSKSDHREFYEVGRDLLLTCGMRQ